MSIILRGQSSMATPPKIKTNIILAMIEVTPKGNAAIGKITTTIPRTRFKRTGVVELTLGVLEKLHHAWWTPMQDNSGMGF